MQRSKVMRRRVRAGDGSLTKKRSKGREMGTSQRRKRGEEKIWGTVVSARKRKGAIVYKLELRSRDSRGKQCVAGTRVVSSALHRRQAFTHT